MVGRILTASLYALGVVLYSLGAAGLVRRIGKKSPKILLYHDCAPQETAYTAGLECTTRPSRFKEHLDYLRRHYAVVDLETIVSGRAPDNAVAITFDDGYASVYQNAFPLLKEDRLPATIYLISSAVGNRMLVWVNELNAFLRNNGSKAVECVGRHFHISGNDAFGDHHVLPTKLRRAEDGRPIRRDADVVPTSGCRACCRHSVISDLGSGS